jgi:hypothetical protein
MYEDFESVNQRTIKLGANVIGLYMFMGGLKVDMKDYEARLVSGEIKHYK